LTIILLKTQARWPPAAAVKYGTAALAAIAAKLEACSAARLRDAGINNTKMFLSRAFAGLSHLGWLLPGLLSLLRAKTPGACGAASDVI
jgi:hypothetical protein